MRQEKRARRVTARPEPTIIGNCEGWKFIVGKKPKTYSPKSSHQESLQSSNSYFIHNLFTSSVDDYLDNLWANCGSPVGLPPSSRIVGFSAFNMTAIRNVPLYSNQKSDSHNKKLVSTNINFFKKSKEKIFFSVLLRRNPIKKTPNPSPGWGLEACSEG